MLLKTRYFPYGPERKVNNCQKRSITVRNGRMTEMSGMRRTDRTGGQEPREEHVHHCQHGVPRVCKGYEKGVPLCAEAPNHRGIQ